MSFSTAGQARYEVAAIGAGQDRCGTKMFIATVEPSWDLQAWREAARLAWRASIPPEAIEWNGDAQAGLIGGQRIETLAPVREAPHVPSAFMTLASAVLCHRHSQRHALLYRLLWRIGRGERGLLEQATDPDVHRAEALAKAVRRDSHKMKAFVRFREVPGEVDTFVAWFEPEHHIVDRVAPFFARRFAGMRWAILTPTRSAHWDGQALAFGSGRTRAEAPADDAREALWQTYYANIFNPARLNPSMMRSEMPQKYWKHLPEATLLPGLLREAGPRVRRMAERTPEAPRRRIPFTAPAQSPVPEQSLEAVHRAAMACRDCELWQPATQTVFGEGPSNAKVVLVGEQPGDEEDLRGRPFVGPAGQLLDQVLVELGIARSKLYLTNAVKHFRFEQRGKRRLHRNPSSRQLHACRPWLEQELARVNPALIVCLGANASRAVLGGQFRLTQQRGQWQAVAGGARALATVHPSWVLRQPNGHAQHAAYELLKTDLAILAAALAEADAKG